jgi:iron complex transport system ATP-binding protein
MLSIRDLSYVIGDRQLLNISALDLAEGKVTALLGTNGAGKSTLFRAITGEIATSGACLFDGRDIHSWDRTELAQQMGVLPQSSQLSFGFQVKEVVELGLIPLSVGQSEARYLVNNAMQVTHTEHLADRLYPSLSGGERQRVQFARILVQVSQARRPPLLLLDEPTSAQDLGQQHALLELVTELTRERGFTVITILHDLNQALRYSDHVWILERGQVVRNMPPRQALTEDTIESVWGYRPKALNQENGSPVFV